MGMVEKNAMNAIISWHRCFLLIIPPEETIDSSGKTGQYQISMMLFPNSHDGGKGVFSVGFAAKGAMVHRMGKRRV